MTQSLQYHLDLSEESTWFFNTAPASVRKNLLYLQEAGNFRAGPGYFTTREGFDSFLIKLTISGCGLLTYGDRQYRIPPGQFYWIDCQQRQDYRTDPDTGAWHVCWVHLNGPSARFFYESFLQHTCGEPVGTLPHDSKVYDILQKILSLSADSDNQMEKDLRLSVLLTQLLTQLLFCVSSSSPQLEPPPILQKVHTYLTEHYNNRVTLQDLSARFSLSPGYLQRQFKAHFGQSPAEFLIYLRIVHAKEQLRTTQKSVSEIAYETGFESPGYLSRLFKQHEGITPQEYRRLWPQMDKT